MTHAVPDRGAGHGTRDSGGPRLLDVGDVGGRYHRQHAPQGTCGRRVDVRDTRVRVRAPEHGGVGNVGDLEVVDEGAAPGEEPSVLAARHGRADVSALWRSRANGRSRSRHRDASGGRLELTEARSPYPAATSASTASTIP